MELPIGIRGRSRGVPWLAGLLIAICAGLSGFAWHRTGAVQAEISAAREAALDYYSGRPYLDVDEASAALLWPEQDAGSRQATIAKLRRAYPFRVVALQHAMDQPELDRQTALLAGALDQQLSRRLGFTPAAPSATGWLTHLFMETAPARLVANLLFLFLAGCALESLWPRLGFALLFLAAGAASAVSLRILAPGSELPVVGAAGAVSGLMGAMLARWPFAKLELGPIAVPVLLLPIAWLAADLFALPLLEVAEPSAGWSHLAGFGLGVGFALALRAAGLEHAASQPQSRKRSTNTTDPAAQLRREVQAGRLDQALEQLEALDDTGAADPLVLVRLGTRLAQAGRTDEGMTVLRRALPAEGGSLTAPNALRIAREVQPLDAGLAVRAARCGLADPGIDDALRESLQTLAGPDPEPEAAPAPPRAPAGEPQGADSDTFEHGVVDLSGGGDDTDLNVASESSPLEEFDVNDMGTNFDFDEDEEKPE